MSLILQSARVLVNHKGWPVVELEIRARPAHSHGILRRGPLWSRLRCARTASLFPPTRSPYWPLWTRRIALNKSVSASLREIIRTR